MDIKFQRPIRRNAKPVADSQASLGAWTEALAAHSPGKYCRHKAIELFVKHDVKIVGGFDGETLMPNQGWEGTVLIGTWERQPQEGLFVRINYLKNDGHDREKFGIALQQTGRDFGEWFFEPNSNYELRGFITMQNTSLALTEAERAMALINEFSSILDAYDLVAKSR